jgi:signal transduction histidine kinase
VRVAGFGEVAPFRPVLRAVRVAAEGRGEPPPPVPVDEGGTRWADMQFEYVVLTATFLGVRQGLGERLIECAAVGQTFQAIAAGDAAPLPRMGEGDVIRLSGICELTTTHLLPRVFWVDGFRVRLPGEGGGVEVVRRRPWWTSGRLLGALAITSAAALAGVLASWALGRQVRRQMGVIAEKLRGETVAAERNRIARDLHDTLEQQLYGVALKLDGLSGAVLRDAAEAEKSLALVRQMLEFTRLEARRSIWDLRSEVLEREGLAEALRGMAANLSGGGGPSVSAKVEGEPRRLSGAVEFHLFRIAQEAATNALRHAGAREIGVGLEFGERRVRLEVRDDGRGFDPDAARRVREGHFGLTGMRERAAKIGATLEVVSRPGAGCLVAAEVEC